MIWYKNIVEMVQNCSDAELKRYVQKHQINVEHCTTESIRKWINNLKEFQRKFDVIPKNDIRRYFQD